MMVELSALSVLPFVQPVRGVTFSTTKKEMAGYCNQLAAISSYCRTVEALQLPILAQPPDWMVGARKRLLESQAEARAWQMTGGPLLNTAPQAVLQYNKVFAALAGDITHSLCVLSNGPQQEAQERLVSHLHFLAESVQGICRMVEGSCGNIQRFRQQITSQHVFFADLYEDVARSEQTQSARVKELQKAVNALEAEIKTHEINLNASEVATGISLGVFLFMIPIMQGVSAAIPLFLCSIVCIVTGFGAAAAIIMDIVESEKIRSLNRELLQKKNELADISDNMVSLHLAVEKLKALDAAAAPAQAGLGGVQRTWETFGSNLKKLAALFTVPGDHAEQAGWMLEEMKQAQKQWDGFTQYCKTLNEVKLNTDIPVAKLVG